MQIQTLAMITLTKRLRQESEGSKPTKTKKEEGSSSRVSIRDKLLIKEVTTVQHNIVR